MNQNPSSTRVAAIVVTYQPDIGVLAKLLRAITPQVSQVVVVDNGSGLAEWENICWEICGSKFLPIPLSENSGIATAQNKGIEALVPLGFDYILLLDHDSLPANDMVEKLIHAAQTMADQGYQVAAVGPRYLDERQNNPPPFIRIQGLKVQRCSCTTLDAIVPVDYLISSGCLIPMATIGKVGVMEDRMFIDYVDIEWGLRAKHLGYQSFGVCGAAMFHSLGESPINFFGRQIPVHTPLRHYYHFRNAIWLYRQSWPALNWKLADGWRLLLKYGFYSLLVRPRLEQFRMMTLGIWHGLCGRMGRFDNA